MTDCPFCRPTPGRVKLENELCVFSEGDDPVLAGSGLIIPRAHRATVFDLSLAEWMATQELLLRVQSLMVRDLNPDGFNVGWNCGAVGGQEIHHAHLHVIARFADEPFAGKGIRHWLKSDANRRPQ